MKQRLEQFLSSEKLSKAQFADRINVARAGISHIMAGRNNPSYEFIINTMNAFPDLNIEWLLKGIGRMYKSADLFTPREPSGETLASTASATTNANTGIRRIVVFFDDGTFKEFC